MLGENHSGLIFEKIKKEMLLNDRPPQASFSIDELNFQKYYEKEKLAENFGDIMKFLENIPIIGNKRCKEKIMKLFHLNINFYTNKMFVVMKNYYKYEIDIVRLRILVTFLG